MNGIQVVNIPARSLANLRERDSRLCVQQVEDVIARRFDFEVDRAAGQVDWSPEPLRQPVDELPLGNDIEVWLDDRRRVLCVGFLCRLIPEAVHLAKESVESGRNFIRTAFYNADSRICIRFFERDIRDPFTLDLYDQAEFLGLLVDFGDFDEGDRFAQEVERRFRKGDYWYCRIDLLGRRWGKNFLRWGIVPFWYQRSRLERALRNTS